MSALYEEAGKPSLRQLARRSENHLAASTIGSWLNGRALPSEALTHDFLALVNSLEVLAGQIAGNTRSRDSRLWLSLLQAARRERDVRVDSEAPVDWAEIVKNPAIFETLVGLLILRIRPHAQVVQGNDKDRGYDVFEHSEVEGFVQYELKAFTGRMTSDRRAQIRRSLQRLAPQPDRWDLVAPIDPTPPEASWFADLRAEFPFVRQWNGLRWLNRVLSGQPDLVAHVVGSSPDLLGRRLRDAMASRRSLPGKGAPDPLGGHGSLRCLGFGDRPADEDLLNRDALVAAIADLLVTAEEDARTMVEASGGFMDATGPTVVALEGPWGSGKTSMMRLIEREVLRRQPALCDTNGPQRRWWRRSPEHLSVKAALLQLIRTAPEAPEYREVSEAGKVAWAVRPSTSITAHFNPWAHQTNDQIWAGLTRTIVEAAQPALGPHGRSREAYWLRRNSVRLDRHQLRRTMLRRLCSPLLRVAVFALLAPLVAQLAKGGQNYDIAGHQISAVLLAGALPTLLAAAGVIHTVLRLAGGRARSYLPGELLDGPVMSGPLASGGSGGVGDALRDPYYNARSGYLYLVQHDIRELLATLKEGGHELIVFIDDLDRCSPRVTADVFEAVNLFLSGALHVPTRQSAEDQARCRFVLGLDPGVVAAHLDRAYADLATADLADAHQDPSAGWTFLRKLVQLPVALPPTSQGSVEAALTGLLGDVALWAPVTVVAPDEAGEQQSVAAPAQAPSSTTTYGRTSETEVLVRALETDPSVRDQLGKRLSAQKDLSLREVKRLLTLWQFYLRVLGHKEHGLERLSVQEAVHLVVLSEIAARWPALQTSLRRRFDGVTGLAILAESTTDDLSWARALRSVGLDDTRHAKSCIALRSLLAEHEGKVVAELAERLS
ncbi:P-loop NTPase fold protein [Streptomyces cyaneochromogenes]|uniref:P-loop NTPase fold protein n=1 Tax=Streptomyces cyaneochromogenes TaxID=2496836 RepID=UPI00158CFCF1|nr:P-loop NTPase fold protein [Streptomyces cyaneochromogenes]